MALHRHLRPFAAAVALVLLASAVWWLGGPTELAQGQRPATSRTDPAAPSGAGLDPQPQALSSPRVGKELLAEAPAEKGRELALPGALPALDAVVAPPLPDPEPPIEQLQVQGQLHPAAGHQAAVAAWPVVQRCAGQWQGLIRLEFGMAGGEIVGSSRFWEPKASGASPEIAACIVRDLADLRTAAATDAGGAVQVEYRMGKP